MFQYVARRVLVAVPMLLGAMSIVFFAMRILPGDPCVSMMGDQATREALADCTKNLGLHRPLAVQYVDYLWRSVQFDFGNSLRQGYPVSEYISRMFPHTLVLVLAAAVVAALVDGAIAMIRSGEVFTQPRDFLAAVADVLHHLALPALALGFTLAATVSRLSRSAMLEVISQDYIRTARAKGHHERAVVYKHALRNMMV